LQGTSWLVLYAKQCSKKHIVWSPKRLSPDTE
jgi:hypothetical protein